MGALENLKIAIDNYNNNIKKLKKNKEDDTNNQLLIITLQRFQTTITSNIYTNFWNIVNKDYTTYTSKYAMRPPNWAESSKVKKVINYAKFFDQFPFYLSFEIGSGFKLGAGKVKQIWNDVQNDKKVEITNGGRTLGDTSSKIVASMGFEPNTNNDKDTKKAEEVITNEAIDKWFLSLPYLKAWYDSKFASWRKTHSKRSIYESIEQEKDPTFIRDYEAYRDLKLKNTKEIDTEEEALAWLNQPQNNDYKKFYYTEVNPENDSSYTVLIMYQDLFVEKNAQMINKYQRYLDSLGADAGADAGAGAGAGDAGSGETDAGAGETDAGSGADAGTGETDAGTGETDADKILKKTIMNDLQGVNAEEDEKFVDEWLTSLEKVNGKSKSNEQRKNFHHELKTQLLSKYKKSFKYLEAILAEDIVKKLLYHLYRNMIEKFDESQKVKVGMNLEKLPLLTDVDGDGEITEADFARKYGLLNPSTGKYIIDDKIYSKEYVQAQVNRANVINPYTQEDPNARIDPTTIAREFEGDSRDYEEYYSGGSTRPQGTTSVPQGGTTSVPTPVNINIAKPTDPVIDKKSQILDMFQSRSESQAVMLEDKKRNEKNLSTLKEEIRCFHKIYNDLIPIFTSKEHKEKYDKALKSDSVKLVKEHHIEMSDQIRKYFKTTELKLGVIMSAESVFGSGEIGHIPSMMGTHGQGVSVERSGLGGSFGGGGGSTAIAKGKDRYANAKSGERNIIRGGVNSRKAIGKAIPKDIDNNQYIGQIPEPNFSIDDAFRPRTYLRRRVHLNPSVKIKSNNKI